MVFSLGFKVVLLGCLLFIVSAAACVDEATPAPTTTPIAPSLPVIRIPPPGVELVTSQTDSYRVEVWTGPMLTMMGEFPMMSLRDQAQPVNHHLEVHIFDRSSGEAILDLPPAITIESDAIGASRQLALDQEAGMSQGISFVTACMISEHRVEDRHFGDNIYLPDGAYAVTVVVGGETAVLTNITAGG